MAISAASAFTAIQSVISWFRLVSVGPPSAAAMRYIIQRVKKPYWR